MESMSNAPFYLSRVGPSYGGAMLMVRFCCRSALGAVLRWGRGRGMCPHIHLIIIIVIIMNVIVPCLHQ